MDFDLVQLNCSNSSFKVWLRVIIVNVFLRNGWHCQYREQRRYVQGYSLIKSIITPERVVESSLESMMVLAGTAPHQRPEQMVGP